MNRKGCLKIFLIIIIVITLLIGWIIFGQYRRERQAKIDEIEQNKICDSEKYITEQPKITFIGFTKKEVRHAHFYLIRKNIVIHDSIIVGNANAISENIYSHFQIPFSTFLKSDTIIAKISNRYFILPKFHHYAYLHYGMFGYVGNWDCRLGETKMIEKSVGTEKNILPK
jgi:hypothetical protein